MPSANAYEAVTKLRGLAKKMGSTLSVERFLEMRQEDLRFEEEKINSFFHGPSPESPERAER